MVEATEIGEQAASLPPRCGRGPRHASVDEAIQAAMDAGAGETITIGEVLDVLATRSIGPVLFIPTLIAVLPGVGALPGVTWTVATLVLLIAVQMIFTHNSHWAPQLIRRLKMKRSLLRKSLRMARRPARWIDRVTEPRLAYLVRGPFAKLMGLSVLLMGVVMFIVSLIPGGAVAPGVVVLILAVALITEDGVVALVGHGLSLGAVAAAWSLVG